MWRVLIGILVTIAICNAYLLYLLWRYVGWAFFL